MALMEIEKPRSAQGVIDEVCQTIVRRATAGSAGMSSSQVHSLACAQPSRVGSACPVA